MKRLNNFVRRSGSALLATLILTILFGAAATARAQSGSVAPILECVTNNQNDGTTTAYFGYNNTTGGNQIIASETSRNYFSPYSADRGQPSYFLPGEHRAAFSTTTVLSSGVPTLTWHLDGNSASFNANSTPCRTGTITYQGRLTNAGTAATGNFDLQFQLFDQQTNGNAVGSIVSTPNTAVTNGVFTVALDFGISAFNTRGKRWLEIRVRQAGGTSAYATLAPRQPLTDTPFAVFAANAANAANADQLGGYSLNYFTLTYDSRLSDARAPTAGSANYIQNSTAQQANSNFNVSGSGTLGGTLSADTVTANSSATNNVILGQSTSTIGTWLSLRNNSTGGGIWNIISSGSANGEGAGNLLFNNTGGTRLILGGNGSLTNGGGVLARGGAPGANGANNNGYAFSGNNGDNDSGLFSEANGQVSLFTNSGERVRAIDSGVNVYGNLTVTGAISGATKNFKIDHPLDPLNKTLTYTSVESPDMMNIYNGNVLTDASGEAIVQMPAYFEALNKDFRYQLTVIGQFAQAIVAEEIAGNQFKIKTDKPNVKVSWQVTGIRHDKFAEDNRKQVEENKTAADKGRCLYAPACQNKVKD